MRRLMIIAIVAISVWVGVAPATAHIYQDSKRWFFGGATWKKYENGDLKGRLDPVNYMFHELNGQATLDAVEHELNENWGGTFTPPNREMDNWSCLTTRFSKPQWVGFYARNNYQYSPPGIPWSLPDIYDRDFSTNSACGKQYHMRAWDDVEHDYHTISHNLNSWVVGGIHHDRLCYCGSWHKIGNSWDVAQRTLYNHMNENCGYLKWRVLPGSGGDFQGKPSDGYITLLRIRRVSGSSGCGRSP